MKKIFIIIAFLLFNLKGFTQSEISISGGLSFPSGDFGTTSGGAAKIGITGDIMYQHATQDKSKLWLAGIARFQSYKIDVAEFEQTFPGTKISASHWEAFSFLVGPVIRFESSENISFEPRIMLGFMAAKSPNVTVNGGTTSVSVASSNGNAFATMLGASFKFKVTNNMSIVSGLDYLTANPKFNVTAKSGTMSASAESNQQISSFSLLVGLSFKLK